VTYGGMKRGARLSSFVKYFADGEELANNDANHPIKMSLELFNSSCIMKSSSLVCP
jgi:hypothetical protein